MESTAGPVAWLVTGHPNSGKSTLGRALAAEVGAAVLDQDVLTNPMLAEVARLVGAGEDMDHPGLPGSVRAARYGCLLDTARDNLDIGRSVVLVAPFTDEVFDTGAFARLVERLWPALARVVWVEVPPEITAARRRHRNLPRDAAGTRQSRPTGRPVVPHVLADGTADSAGESARLAALFPPR